MKVLQTTRQVLLCTAVHGQLAPHGLIVSLFCLKRASQYSGSCVNYSTYRRKEEGPGGGGGLGAGSQTIKPGNRPPCIVRRHHSSPVSLLCSLCSVYPVLFRSSKCCRSSGENMSPAAGCSSRLCSH